VQPGSLNPPAYASRGGQFQHRTVRHPASGNLAV